MKKEESDLQVRLVKDLRKDLYSIQKRIENLNQSREVLLSRTRLQESSMWLGQELGRLGTLYPYPESRNKDNLIIEKPTAPKGND